MAQDRAVVVIPALNEAVSIGQLVRCLTMVHNFPVIVMDDGSSDDTGRKAGQHGALVLRHDSPRGIAASTVDLWWEALAWRYERVVQMDAGFSHLPEDVGKLLAVLDYSGGMVVGSRFAPGGRYEGGTVLRRAASRLAAAMCNFAQVGAHYTDWTSGFRAYRRDVLERLCRVRYWARGHAFQMEVLARAGEMGVMVAECPITYVAGRSSLRWRSGWEAFQIWGHILHHIGTRKQTRNGNPVG